MIITTPQPFIEAIASREVKTILPTSASSRQLMKLAPEIRERAMFSARTTNADYLQKVNDLVTRIVSPETIKDPATGQARPARPGEYMDQATARLELKTALQDLGYQPDPEKRGTLQDLSSDIRLNTILETNTKMAQGYAYYEQGQDPVILDQWPGQELFRAEERKAKRPWGRIWNEARASLGGSTRALPAEDPFAEDGMFAPKNDPIWTAISVFGLPYPPFDFGSGMEVRDVDYDTSVELGIITPADTIAPDSRGFNQDLEAAPGIRDQSLLSALLESMDGKVSMADGVLKFLGGA